jgi:pimeloyl-ACP methyl ester carboxylesterase
MMVYFISGVAADRRVFRHIRVPAECQVEYLDWLSVDAEETIPEYARRLAAGMDMTQPFALVGLSLGGIIATEMALAFRPVVTVIIGSVSNRTQLPRYFRTARRLGFTHWLPPTLFKCTATLKRLFTRERLRDKWDLVQMIWSADGRLIRWAMDKVPLWENSVTPPTLWHIHGTRDEVFPIGRVRPTHVIKGGGHMLVMSHAAEVNRILAEILGDIGRVG